MVSLGDTERGGMCVTATMGRRVLVGGIRAPVRPNAKLAGGVMQICGLIEY